MADWDSFKVKLTSEICSYKPNSSINEGAQSLVDAISRAAKYSIPLKGRTSRTSRPPWWIPELTASNKKVNKFRNTKEHKTTDRWKYRKIRNEHLGLIRETRF
jgi:hypothetical protein